MVEKLASQLSGNPNINGGHYQTGGNPGAGSYWFSVDIPNRKIFHNGSEVVFDVALGQNGQTVYLALYDGTSSGTGTITINQVYEVFSLPSKNWRKIASSADFTKMAIVAWIGKYMDIK